MFRFQIPGQRRIGRGDHGGIIQAGKTRGHQRFALNAEGAVGRDGEGNVELAAQQIIAHHLPIGGLHIKTRIGRLLPQRRHQIGQQQQFHIVGRAKVRRRRAVAGLKPWGAKVSFSRCRVPAPRPTVAGRGWWGPGRARGG
jgi:hypothetical protein